MEAQYDNNHLHGLYMEWHENGSLKKKSVYRFGELAELEENFAQDGRKLTSEGVEHPSNVAR